jgi:hypothetical protein
MKVSDMVQLFESLVSSIIVYASEVWGFIEATNVHIIQNKFCRIILGVKKLSNLVGMYGEPFSVIRKFKIIKYWAHILQHQNSVQFKIYQMLKEDVNRGAIYNGQHWAHQVKVILEELG